MRTVLTALFAILLFVLGCWTPGDIQEHLPKHRDKFPAETVFFVDKTEPRVTNALVDALKARGFKVTWDRALASVALETRVQAWEYNDAGFSGFRSRDDMSLVITVTDRKTKLVRARSHVEVRSDFRILEKYVKTL